MKVFQASREAHPNTPVIMVTGAPEVSTAAEAVRLGAFDYVTKPLHQDDLLRQAKLAVDHKRLIDQQEMYQLRMAAIFQSVDEGLLLFDEKMKLIEINAAASKMLCCDASILGLSPSEISACCPALKSLQGLIEARCEGEIFRVEAEARNGQPVAFGVTMTPLTGHDQRELGTVLVLRDETKPARQVV